MKRQQQTVLTSVILVLLAGTGILAAEPWEQDAKWPAWTTSGQGPGAAEAVAAEEAQQWLRWVIRCNQSVLHRNVTGRWGFR